MDRRLRLGFVSPDLHRHPVGFLLQAVAPALDRSRVETIFYADGTRSDDVTERLRASADRWRPIDGLADAAVAELIRRDEIDVLVDLAGHTANNRLLVFAHRPAPIQATWLGFFGTTGLPAIDYLIADPIVCPPDHDRDYVERILRLPDSFACYAPPVVDVAVTPPPALDRGQVTFGCFNNLAKVTPATLALWVAVLEAVPSSRLLLKAAPLADPGTVARLRNRFADLGIDPVRLELVGRSANADYLSAYGDVDVALDPIPFTGGMTSLDALWMGVPVVTLAGDRFAARMSASFLHTLGLPELVATTPEAYVAIAAGLASDLGRLPELRTTLRPRMAASPLCDARGFAGAFEQALRQAWHAR